MPRACGECVRAGRSGERAGGIGLSACVGERACVLDEVVGSAVVLVLCVCA